MSNLRRFYFDDGHSRKRWHISTKGKSQTVQYGRLNGTLRESKKSLSSPAQAKQETAKLIAKKQREGYVEVDPGRLEIVRPKGRRKATEQQVRALEKQIGCKLPQEYRQFLLTVNGGHPNPDCVPVPGMKGIANVGVGALCHLQPSKPAVDELTYEINRIQNLVPDPSEHLPIASCSDLYTLSLNPKSFGAVYWWNHDTEEVDDDGRFFDSAKYLLAGSFDEFLSRISRLFDDDEDPKSNGSATTATKKPKATIKRLLRLVRHDHTPDKVKEIEQAVKELGDLSGIQDQEWPFINISSPRVLRCLLNAGLNPEIVDDDYHSLLWQCAGSRECIDLLAKHDIRIDRQVGPDGETALMRAIYVQNIPAVKRLLQLGANPTVRLSWPFKHALEENTRLRKVIEQARDDWKKANKGKKKSRPAKARPQPAGTKKKKGPKPTIPRLLRLLKHDVILQFEQIEGVEELIAELGDLSSIEDGKWPKIHKFENPVLLGWLLEANLNPEISDKEGNSLLRQCAVSPECIDLLVQRGVDLDRRSGRDNATALMQAATFGDEDCVKRLLAAGANPTLELTPFAEAILDMDQEMNSLLESACARWKRKKKPRKKAAKKKVAGKRRR